MEFFNFIVNFFILFINVLVIFVVIRDIENNTNWYKKYIKKNGYICNCEVIFIGFFLIKVSIEDREGRFEKCVINVNKNVFKKYKDMVIGDKFKIRYNPEIKRNIFLIIEMELLENDVANKEFDYNASLSITNEYDSFQDMLKDLTRLYDFIKENLSDVDVLEMIDEAFFEIMDLEESIEYFNNNYETIDGIKNTITELDFEIKSLGEKLKVADEEEKEHYNNLMKIKSEKIKKSEKLKDNIEINKEKMLYIISFMEKLQDIVRISGCIKQISSKSCKKIVG